MPKRILLLFIVVFAVGMLILLAVFALKRDRAEFQQVCFAEHCFEVELAQSPAERAQGLMFRKELAMNRGMLFVFENEAQHSFWMKNTFIPLDIIWLAQGGEVVFIKENAQPCGDDPCLSITADRKAKYVLELNGGVVQGIGLQTGDTVFFE